MTDSDEYAESLDYSSLGLVANPFRTARSRASEPVGVAMEIQAAANALIAALVSAQLANNGRPIWVEKSKRIPDYYHLAAVAQAEKRLINDDELGVVHTYLQLYMLRLGRIRSALQFLAERVAVRDFDQTLAAWVSEILQSPDETIEAYEVVQPFLEDFTAEFAADPLSALASVFGDCEIERDFKALEMGDIRQSSQAPDIEEEDDAAPEAVGDEGLPPTVVVEEATEREAAIIDYIVEYTRAHLSPVLGRAIRVYGLRGTGSLANEIVLTRAPRKTYKALTIFATKRFNRVALIYDGFANWAQVPEDLKERFVSALTELRMAMRERGNIVFLAATQEVPEIEEVLRTGPEVRWDFEGLSIMEDDPDKLNLDVVRGWIECAALDGADVGELVGSVTALSDAAGGSIAVFVGLAGEAVDEAARRGMASPDDEAIEHAKSWYRESALEST